MADISRDEYDKIKTLLELDIKHSTIAKVVGRSHASVSRVAKTMDYQEFNRRTGRVVNRKPKQPEQASLIAQMPNEDVYTKLEHLEKKIDQLLIRVESRVEKKKGIWR